MTVIEFLINEAFQKVSSMGLLFARETRLVLKQNRYKWPLRQEGRKSFFTKSLG